MDFIFYRWTLTGTNTFDHTGGGNSQGTFINSQGVPADYEGNVFLGGAIGLFTGRMVARYSPFLKQHNVTFRPFNEEGAVGVAVSLRH